MACFGVALCPLNSYGHVWICTTVTSDLVHTSQFLQDGTVTVQEQLYKAYVQGWSDRPTFLFKSKQTPKCSVGLKLRQPISFA